MEIERRAHRVGRPVAGKIEMRNLSQRVYTGIGTAGTVDRDLLARQSVNRLRQTPLHRNAYGLHLPTDEGRTVILERNVVAWHSRPEESAIIAGPLAGPWRQLAVLVPTDKRSIVRSR